MIRFTGAVKWVAGPGIAGVTLLGRILEADGSSTPAELSLLCGDAPQLPRALPDLVFEALAAPEEVLLRSGAHSWRLRCATWQLHRDVGTAFYAAIPPRRTPWTRRLTWRVLLGVAASPPGRWLLSRRSRPKL
jgi:hypothetical protein